MCGGGQAHLSLSLSPPPPVPVSLSLSLSFCVTECISTLCLYCTLYVALSVFFCVWTSFSVLHMFYVLLIWTSFSLLHMFYVLLIWTSLKDVVTERASESRARGNAMLLLLLLPLMTIGHKAGHYCHFRVTLPPSSCSPPKKFFRVVTW